MSGVGEDGGAMTRGTDLIAAALVEMFGERGPDFDPDCVGCQAWAEYDRLTALSAPVQEPPVPAPVVPAEGLDALVALLGAYRTARMAQGLTEDEVVRLPIVLAAAVAITALRAAPPVGARVIAEKAYLAGFNAAGEGYNGEWPFHDKGISPDTDEGWLIGRDMALAALLPAGEGEECPR